MRLSMAAKKGPASVATLLSVVGVALLIWLYRYASVNTFVLVFSFIVLFLVAKGIAAGWYAQAVVLVGGVALLLATSYLLPEVAITTKSSGSPLLDVFVAVKQTFSEQAAGLGLTIMVIAGFSRYMDEIGAADKLVELCVIPLQKVKSRYILLGLSYAMMQILSLFIPSASGLGLLMMATLYPVLRTVGCSKESVAAIIASGVCIDFGPAASSMIVGAEVAKVDLFGFFVYEQLPVALVMIPFIAVMHMIMLRYWDNKSAAQATTADVDVDEKGNDPLAGKNTEKNRCRRFTPCCPPFRCFYCLSSPNYLRVFSRYGCVFTLMSCPRCCFLSPCRCWWIWA